jgi:hypothetical protein
MSPTELVTVNGIEHERLKVKSEFVLRQMANMPVDTLTGTPAGRVSATLGSTHKKIFSTEFCVDLDLCTKEMSGGCTAESPSATISGVLHRYPSYSLKF